ncbi:MAG: shikimate dehydrogenase [Patescibacteria group bacterium]
MKKYGILAYPAKHSLSPVMHNAAFKELGIEAEYEIFEIAEDGLAEFFERVRNEPISGLSVSLPYKETIMEFLDEVDENAANVGAVNTVLNRDGKLYGFNTDYLGAIEALKESVGQLSGKSAVIMGAGGTARAIIYGLLKEGVDVRAILNRNQEKALNMTEDFYKLFEKKIEIGELGPVNRPEADILIQATSIWTLNPDITEEEIKKFCPKEYLEKFEVVMDVVYKPLITPVLDMANELGLTTITAEKMLLYQAVEQFKLWTKKEAPVDVMRRALNDSLV